MDGESLAKQLASVHVSDARHEPVTPVLLASDAQGNVLSDEDLVENILFSVSGRSPRMRTVNHLMAFSDSLMKTMLNARLVCKTWSAVSARPLLAIKLDSFFAQFKTYTDFAYRSRLTTLSGEQAKTWRAAATSLELADTETLIWAIRGFENGFHSALADDDGLKTAEVAAELCAHLWRNRIHGPFAVFAPLSKRVTWERLLAAVQIPVVHVDDADELLGNLEFKGALLLPSEAPKDIADDIFQVFGSNRQGRRSCGVRMVICDERHFQSTPLGTFGMGYERLAMRTLLNCPLILDPLCASYVLLTNQPLPNTVEDLCAILEGGRPGAMFDRDAFHFITGEFLTKIGGEARRAELQAWAIEQFAVPTMQSQLSKTYYRRRVKRDGQPVILYVEPAQRAFIETATSDAYSLVHSRVMIINLKSKTQYNGMVGTVCEYSPGTDRYVIRVSVLHPANAHFFIEGEQTMTTMNPWINLQVRPVNVTSVEDCSAEAFAVWQKQALAGLL